MADGCASCAEEEKAAKEAKAAALREKEAGNEAYKARAGPAPPPLPPDSKAAAWCCWVQPWRTAALNVTVCCFG